MRKIDYIQLYLIISVFAIFGIYSIFFSDKASNYDSKTQAYHVEYEEWTDSDHDTSYKPTFYFKANGKEYQCKVDYYGAYPSKGNGIIYYQSYDPTKCATEYEIGDNKIDGILSLLFSAVFFIVFTYVKRKNSDSEQEINIENLEATEEQKKFIVKMGNIMDKIENISILHNIRVLIIIPLFILGIFIYIDSLTIRTTIITKDFVETTATYVETKEKFSNDPENEYVYTFEDKYGNNHEIVVIQKNENPETKIKVKYNENNPENYFTEDSLMNNKMIFWFIIKILATISLIILLFDKKILNKIVNKLSE